MRTPSLIIAALAMTSGSVLAQTGALDYDNLIRTRDITGGDIYTMNAAEDELSWGTDTAFDEIGPDWNNIGEIEDVILDSSGQLAGIVGEIGGFVDIGDKHVFLPVEDVRLVPVDDGEYVYVTRYSEEQLEQLEDVDEGWWD